MDPLGLFGILGSGLFTVGTILCVCVSTLVPLGVAGFFLFRMFKNMNQNSTLIKTGISAPAVILNAEDTGTTMNESPQVRLTLQVNPAYGPSFPGCDHDLCRSFTDRHDHTGLACYCPL